VERVQIVAICDLDDKRRNKLDDEFGIDALR
jgi:predicted dehydrogenase